VPSIGWYRAPNLKYNTVRVSIRFTTSGTEFAGFAAGALLF
jgi:hypothetical protein